MLRTTSYKLLLTANCIMLHLMLHAHYFFTVNACLCHIPQVVAPQSVCSIVADNPLNKKHIRLLSDFTPWTKHIRIKHIRFSPQQLSRISASYRQAIAWPYIQGTSGQRAAPEAKHHPKRLAPKQCFAHHPRWLRHLVGFQQLRQLSRDWSHFASKRASSLAFHDTFRILLASP
jgi:hypothetical protein